MQNTKRHGRIAWLARLLATCTFEGMGAQYPGDTPANCRILLHSATSSAGGRVPVVAITRRATVGLGLSLGRPIKPSRGGQDRPGRSMPSNAQPNLKPGPGQRVQRRKGPPGPRPSESAPASCCQAASDWTKLQ
jgi:hypothetical protein